MENKENPNAFMFTVCMIVSLLFLLFTFTMFEQKREINDLKLMLIQLGYAKYNETNGNWQFIPNK